MDLIQIVVLALIQGITEFLPISSSAHLILPQALLGWPDQGLAFDVAVHVGTLLAVVIYFRRDVLGLSVGWCRSLATRTLDDQSRLAWFIIFATVPAGLAGLIFGDYIEGHLRSVGVIAFTTVFFGILLGLADYKGQGGKTLKDMTLTFAVLIGVAQAMALIPGTSRSGITMTLALFLGFARTDAARFSFLLSIPVIVLSGGYKSLDLFSSGGLPWGDIATGVFVSAVSAYLCIHFFLSFINRLSMMPFVVYRLLLGVILFAFFA